MDNYFRTDGVYNKNENKNEKYLKITIFYYNFFY